MIVPEDVGSNVIFEYQLSDDLTSSTSSDDGTDSASSSGSSSSGSESGWNNKFTRLMVTYTMSSIFGITFLLGLFNIYRTFYSKEALIREAALKELRERRQQERIAK